MLLLFRARPLPKRAAIRTFAGEFAPVVGEGPSVKTYRDDMRQLCRELLLPPKREWSRPPADVNHNNASLIPALWWPVVGNFVRPNTDFQMSVISYGAAFLMRLNCALATKVGRMDLEECCAQDTWQNFFRMTSLVT